MPEAPAVSVRYGSPRHESKFSLPTISASPLLTLDGNNSLRYHFVVINSFKCKETEKIFNGKFSSRLPQAIQRLAARKLDYLDSAGELDDLRAPPGNRLEALKDDRHGQQSIRINDQWRICFEWRSSEAFNVEGQNYWVAFPTIGTRMCCK